MRRSLEDLRYACRLLRKRPLFALAAVLTFALGIALNTSTFAIVNALWFRPSPFKQSERLVVLTERNTRSGTSSLVSWPAWEDLCRQATSFEGMAALRERECNLALPGGDAAGPESVRAASISAGAVEFMGFSPLLGRSLQAADGASGRRAVMISEQLWKRRFGSDPAVVGREIFVDSEPATLVGILPHRFQFVYGGYEVVQLLTVDSISANRDRRMLYVTARLKPGVGIGQARAELSLMASRIAAQYPETNRDWELHATGHRQFVFGEAMNMYPLLLAAALLVLLIVCANVSSLFLAQAASRRREMAVRAALGAPRARLVRQMLGEGLLVSLAGGSAAYLAVAWGQRILIANYPELTDIQIDWRAFAYTLFVSLVAGTLFGLTPAMTASKPDLTRDLKEGGGAAAPAGVHRLRRILVTSQLSIALALLFGSGLLVRTSLRMIRDAGAGFRTERMLTAQLALRGSRYREAVQRVAFACALEERLSKLPGAESAALADHLPLLGGRMARLETGPGETGSIQVQLRAVSPAFLQAMGIPLLAGRDIMPGDAENAEPVAVVTDAAARKIWPENAGDRLGRMIRVNGGEWRRVVGISADVKQVLVRPAWPEIMIPLAQEAPETLALALRAKGDPASLADGLRGVVGALDPSLPVGSVMTMDEIIRGYFPRVMLVGIVLFSLAATAMAATGLYGVIAFLTAQRTREIGIRMALGADRRQVMRLVVGQSLRLGLWGVGAGFLLALAVGKALASFLYGVGAADPVVFGGVSLFLFAVAVLAGYFPARRAARARPMLSLREG